MGTQSKTQTPPGATHSTSIVSYTPGQIVSHIERCGGEVRWGIDGRLEQAWIVDGIGTTGAIENRRYEWRPVPQPPYPAE